MDCGCWLSRAGTAAVIAGVDTDELGIGSQLRVGPVLLELTQIGKVCHTRCAIYYTYWKACALHPDMPVQIVRMVPRSVIQAAVVTVSDRCAQGKTLDTAKPAVEELSARSCKHALHGPGQFPTKQTRL